MSRLAVLFLVAALACSSDNNELKGTSAALAVKRAATFCNVSASEMTWLGQLIEESKNDIAKEGPIYAFHSNGQWVFMVQPWIMSCLACIMYDCEGNRLDPQDVDKSALSSGFQDLTEIYVPELE